jgi:hypothetical protein
MRLNHIILAKRGSNVCAIKFKNPEQTDNGKLPGSYRVLAEWQRYNLSNNLYQATEKGSGILNSGPMVGLTFHLSYQQNTDRFISCGDNFKISWVLPANINFNNDSKKNDAYNVELFPTNWTEFSMVDLSSPDIKWIKFKEQCFVVYETTPAWIDCPHK